MSFCEYSVSSYDGYAMMTIPEPPETFNPGLDGPGTPPPPPPVLVVPVDPAFPPPPSPPVPEVPPPPPPAAG